MKHYLFLALALLPVIALGQPSDTALRCEIATAAAQAEARLLSSPKVVGSVGDSNPADRAVVIALSQSIQGISQGRLVRDLGELQCQRFAAEKDLRQYYDNATRNNLSRAARLESDALKPVIKMARKQVRRIGQLVLAKAATIADHASVLETLSKLELRNLRIAHDLVDEQVSIDGAGFNRALRKLDDANLAIAHLQSRRVAAAGWDVVLSAGVRQSLKNGEAKPFAMVGFNWSFGARKARDLAEQIRSQTEQLQAVDESGARGALNNYVVELRRQLALEKSIAQSLEQQKAELQAVANKIRSVDSDLANNVTDAMTIKLGALEASRLGSQARLDGYRMLLKQLVDGA